MTYTYNSKVSDVRIGGFFKLLLVWKASVYKLIYKEFLMYSQKQKIVFWKKHQAPFSCLKFLFLTVPFRSLRRYRMLLPHHPPKTRICRRRKIFPSIMQTIPFVHWQNANQFMFCLRILCIVNSNKMVVSMDINSMGG